MRHVAFLTAHYLRAHPVPAVLVAIALALVAFLPAATNVTTARLRRDLTARADATPLVAGALGSPLDLVLEALTYRGGELPRIEAAFLDELREDPNVSAVPILRAGSVRGRPLVATSPEYFEQRRLGLARGGLPLVLGECVVGSALARELDLAPGDRLHTDPTRLYDVTRPQTLELEVTGVLAPTGTADDRAVFCDVRTGWVVLGLYHGHEAAEELDEELLLGETERGRVLSPAVLSVERITKENLASFHLHAERAELPLSLVLLFPRDAKAATLVETRVDLGERHQVVVAREEVDELLARVLDLERFVRLIAALLGLGTALLALVIVALSSRLREAEWRALDRMGAPRSTRTGLHLAFLAAVLVLSGLLFAASLAAWIRFHPDPSRWL